MSVMKNNTTRRAFFLTGGATLGAGVATAVGASALGAAGASGFAPAAEISARSAEEREAIRQLHLAFTSLMETQRYDAASELFDERGRLELGGGRAIGRHAIKQFLSARLANPFHNAYRQNASLQQRDAVTIGEDLSQAAATFHIEVELCTPLRGDSTIAKMARLEGHVAERRWETGRFEATYLKSRGEWRMTSLSYLAA
jgi:SnoaL-like protein